MVRSIAIEMLVEERAVEQWVQVELHKSEKWMMARHSPAIHDERFRILSKYST